MHPTCSGHLRHCTVGRWCRLRDVQIEARHAKPRTTMRYVEWYDELVRLTDSPVALLNRAVAVGEADGPRAGLAALAMVDATVPCARRTSHHRAP